jgi:hypothetical protein
MTQFFDYMDTNDEITLDDSFTANINSEKRNAANTMSENLTGSKARGGSKGKTSDGSKGKASGGSNGKRRISKEASTLRVRKAADNVMESQWGDDDDLSSLCSSKGKESKVNEISDAHRNSNRSKGVSSVDENWCNTDQPSNSKRGRCTMTTETATSNTR